MRSYWFFDQLVDVLVSGDQTAGRYSVCEFWAPPGCQTPLHVHQALDEGWYVVEGELTVWVGDDRHVLGPGDYAGAPGGTPHTFEVTGGGELRGLVTCTPRASRTSSRRSARRPTSIACRCSPARPTSPARPSSRSSTGSSCSARRDAAIGAARLTACGPRVGL